MSGSRVPRALCTADTTAPPIGFFAECAPRPEIAHPRYKKYFCRFRWTPDEAPSTLFDRLSPRSLDGGKVSTRPGRQDEAGVVESAAIRERIVSIRDGKVITVGGAAKIDH